MKWTEKQIESFDRKEQLYALNCTLTFLKNLEEKNKALEIVNQKIGELQQKRDRIQKGISTKALLIISALSVVVLAFLIGFNTSFFLVAVLLIAFKIVDKFRFSKNREEKATDFYRKNIPALLQEKADVESGLKTLWDSDDAYNAELILPDEYLSSERVQVLMNLLSQRRARHISDAMTIYENMEHQKRLEDIELEKLKAMQEARDAQKKAADAAKNTEQLTRQMVKEQKENANRQRQMMEDMARKNNTRTGSASVEKKRKGVWKPCPCCKMEISRDVIKCPYCREDPRRYTFGWDIF